MTMMRNADVRVVRDFGLEWRAFDQSGLADAERAELFDRYFAIFPWGRLPHDAVGFDAGCGSGRWAALVAPRVGHLYAIDASIDALAVCARNLNNRLNVSLYEASVEDMPIDDGSMDFGYSLGVLHHVPDTQGALDACVAKLKPGAPFLLYLYYALDNRPWWYRAIWRASDVVRHGFSHLPHALKLPLSTLIAALVYWPLARLSRAFPGKPIPLADYRDSSFYTMRTDALDRFGTRLEQRFTRDQMRTMMTRAGLTDIRFSDKAPYWVGVGRRRA
jgi:SAM-dependent methyltransferase